MRIEGDWEQEEFDNVNQPKTNSYPLPSRRDYRAMSLPNKEMVEEIKTQWKKLWQERIDDKVRAEGVATNDYSKLFVDKGTIIHATRNFKPLSLKEILEQNEIQNTDRIIPPNPQVGGWTKFIKINITSKAPQRKRRADAYEEPKKIKQQPKKGGRGWLHK